MTRNRLLFLKASHAGLMAWCYRLIWEYGKCLISWTIKPKWRHKALQRSAMIRAIQDYFLGRFGRVDINIRP
jgi:hypothetical protein